MCCITIEKGVRPRKEFITAQKRIGPWKWLAALILVLHLLVTVSEAATVEKDYVYISVYLLGSVPTDRNVYLGGVEQPHTTASGAFGAGLKAGVFPAIANRIVGIEFESSGHGGEIAFPLSLGSGINHPATTDLTVLNTMFNFLIRYPGETLQPYVGIGGGLSSGILTGTDMPGRPDRGFESAPAFAHQFLGGVQVKLTTRTFLFGEYKHFSANYHWAKLSFEFRSQYMLAGMGIQF